MGVVDVENVDEYEFDSSSQAMSLFESKSFYNNQNQNQSFKQLEEKKASSRREDGSDSTGKRSDQRLTVLK